MFPSRPAVYNAHKLLLLMQIVLGFAGISMYDYISRGYVQSTANALSSISGVASSDVQVIDLRPINGTTSRRKLLQTSSGVQVQLNQCFPGVITWYGSCLMCDVMLQPTPLADTSFDFCLMYSRQLSSRLYSLLSTCLLS